MPEPANGEEGMSALPASATRQDASGAQHVVDIQKALTRRVLPALQKQLVSFASPALTVAAEHLNNGCSAVDVQGTGHIEVAVFTLTSHFMRDAKCTIAFFQQVYKDGDILRAPMPLAIEKLLKRLPDAARRAAQPTSPAGDSR